MGKYYVLRNINKVTVGGIYQIGSINNLRIYKKSHDEIYLEIDAEIVNDDYINMCIDNIKEVIHNEYELHDVKVEFLCLYDDGSKQLRTLQFDACRYANDEILNLITIPDDVNTNVFKFRVLDVEKFL